MTPNDMEQVLRDVNLRTSAIEQILPTLSTKADLQRFATKQDLERFATKQELAEAVAMLRGDIEDTRRHARVLNEDVKADIRMLAEHLVSIMDRLERLDRRL